MTYKLRRLENIQIKFYVVCTVHVIVSLSQNQPMQKNINKYKMYLQPIHMFWQTDCHPQRVLIKELQVFTTSEYTIGGFTV